MGYQGKLDKHEWLAQTVVNEYRSGASLHTLACRYRLGWAVLRRTLVSRGVDIRPTTGARIRKKLADGLVATLLDEYRNGASLYELSRRHGIDRRVISRTFQEMGVEVLRRPVREPRSRTVLPSAEVERLRALIGFEESWRRP